MFMLIKIQTAHRVTQLSSLEKVSRPVSPRSVCPLRGNDTSQERDLISDRLVSEVVIGWVEISPSR